MRLLLEANADRDKSLQNGGTPLFVGAQRGHLDVVRLLLEANADRDKARHDGTKPLSVALQDGHFEVASLLRKRGYGQHV